MLNNYCQKQGFTCQDEFVEDNSTEKPMFKCTITCILDGSEIVEHSGRYYSRKDDSKEFATYKILSRLKERERSHYFARGSTGQDINTTQGTMTTNWLEEQGAATITSDAPTTSWISLLKEHYDKQGMAGMELKFTVAVIEGGGFIASIFVLVQQPVGTTLFGCQ
jgi:hypothetical protein